MIMNLNTKYMIEWFEAGLSMEEYLLTKDNIDSIMDFFLIHPAQWLDNEELF